jgi:diaminopimelate decarboxylase
MKLFFPDQEQVLALTEQFGSPLFVYDEQTILNSVAEARCLEAPFGLTLRYAMKANPNRHLLQLLHVQGVQIDASSGYEAWRAMKVGIPGAEILLSAQELPEDLGDLVANGVLFNACSLHQLEVYGRLAERPAEVSVRLNPGEGSGFHKGVNVGGAESSFGIWHEDIPQIHALAEQYGLKISRLHTHIGSGSDPEAWARVAELSLKLLEHFPEANTLNLGGGFKIARVEGEKAFSFADFAPHVQNLLQGFERPIHLEIEPGTFLIGRAGVLLAKVQDITETSQRRFIKLNAGMTEILRPALYGAKHPFEVYPKRVDTEAVQLVGHCCESTDVLNAEPLLLPRMEAGDLLAVGGAGAYCSSMGASNYNSFPRCAEVLIRLDGRFELIRRRETLDEVMGLEA